MADGALSSWDASSGQHAKHGHLQLQPLSSTGVLLQGARQRVAIPVRPLAPPTADPPGGNAPGGAVDVALSGAEDGPLLAVVDLPSLKVEDVLTPASMLSLRRFWKDGAPSQHCS